MSKTNLRKIWWTITILYIIFTYATLGVMPTVWKNFNNFFGGKGVIFQYIIYSLSGISIFIYILFIRKEKSLLRYILFFLFIGIFLIMVKFEKSPAEKIHMAQYGLLGVLVYNTLKIDLDRFSKRLYLYGSVICLIAGALDEVIQGILPNRYFTCHDIIINGVSGMLALSVIRFNILKKLKISSDPNLYPCFGLDSSVLSYSLPLAGVLLIIFSIPLPFQKVIGLSTVYPCDFVFPLVFLGWLAYRITQRKEGLKGGELFLSFLPFMAAGIISAINAKDVFRLTGYIYLWAQIPLAYIMAVNIIKNRHSLNLVFYSSLTAIVLFSGFYIFYFFKFHHFNIAWGEHIFFQKNIIASYLGLGPPLFLGLIFFKSRLKQRILLFVLMAISLAGLVSTSSRGGNLSLLLVLPFFIFFFVKNEDAPMGKYVLFSLSLLFLVYFLYLYFFDEVLYNSLLRLGSSGRIALYKSAIALFKQHPIVGIGMGNSMHYLGKPHVHNIFFHILTETGIIGILTMGFFLWNLVKYLVKVVKTKLGKDKYIIYGAVAALIYFFLHNAFDFTLGHGIGIQLGIILAIIDSVHLQGEKS